MTIAELLKNPEFWAALFGALAAFLLGAFGQWRADSRQKCTAGNLALITLAQMYMLIESLRQQLFVDEARRQTKLLGKPPFEYQLRGISGLPNEPLRINPEQLGFLAESHDPDVLNRIISIDRAFASMLEVIEQHRQLQLRLQERVAAHDTDGKTMISPREMPTLVGMSLFAQVVSSARALQEGLPEVREAIASSQPASVRCVADAVPHTTHPKV